MSVKSISFVTVANFEHLNLIRLKEQYKTADIDLRVLGMNADIEFGWDFKGSNFGFKIEMLRKYLETIKDPSQIVCFTDGFDVIFNRSSEKEILSKFSVFDAKAVFSAEKVCHPNRKLASQYPSTDSVYKYLNSGTFIGEAKYLLDMMNKYPYDMQLDDQLYWTQIFLKEQATGDIKLDYYSSIFMCTANSLLDVDLDASQNRFMNVLTKSHPSFIHLNGIGPVTYTTYDSWLQTGKKSGFGFIGALQRGMVLKTFYDVNQEWIWSIGALILLLIIVFIISIVRGRGKLKNTLKMYQIKYGGI